MTPEGRIVCHIKKVITAHGGAVRKVSWEGRVGAPDLLIMIGGRHWFIECKAPGESPRPSQLREFSIMENIGGCRVEVIDSVDSFALWWSRVQQLQVLK